jgi:hypothetical protein
MQQAKEYEPINNKMPPLVANSYKYIKEFKEIAEENEYSFLIVTLPSAEAKGTQFTALINNLKNEQINYYDTSFITPLFAVKEYQASAHDWHPSALVHKKIGEMLSDYIANNLLPKKWVRKN